MARHRDNKRIAQEVRRQHKLQRRGKNMRRIAAYIGAGREVRDHLGNVVVTEDAAQDARAGRIVTARALGASDQTGVGFRV